jgi:outer membrane protein TolC
MQMVEATNLELAIADQDVEIAFRNRQLTKSALFPQFRVDPNAQNIQLRGLEDVIPNTTAGLGFRLQQMIYNDQFVSDHKSASRQSDGVRQDREAQRLDVMNTAGQAFLRLAGSHVLYRVELDNLRLTEENLELAKLREKVGYSGKDEVFRWEAEVAKRKARLLAREARIETNRLALNQILAIDQQTRWLPEEIEVDPESWPFLDGRLNPYGQTIAGTARLLDVMVELAIESAPEIRSTAMNIDAQEITLGERKRRWYLPVFGFDAAYDVDLYQSPEIPGVGNDFWSFRVSGNYPIFQGGARKQNIRLESAALTRLERQQDLQTNLVERATRTSWRRMEGSFAMIRYNRIAAENAEKNLAVVQDKYALGLVNVTDLFQAQNETFTAQQAEVVSNYAFLSDLVDFQRSISWFESEKTDADKETFLQRVEVEMERQRGERE